MNSENEIYQNYLSLIGIDEIEKPSFNFLSKIHLNHIEKIGYTNFDFIFGDGIQLDPARTVFKLVMKHQGGVCYELNYVFSELLKFLGFEVKLVYANLPKAGDLIFSHSEIAHVIGVVFLDNNKYLVDVGFGDWCRKPVLLKATSCTDISGSYRVICDDRNPNKFIMQNKKKGRYRFVYDFFLDNYFVPPVVMNYSLCPFEVYPNLYGDFVYVKPNQYGSKRIINYEYINIINNESKRNKIFNADQFFSILKNEFDINEDFIKNIPISKVSEYLFSNINTKKRFL